MSSLSEKWYTADYYLFLFYSKYFYGDLSKLFLFLLSRDWTTRRYINWYLPLTHSYSFILDMFYIKLSWKFVFLINIECVVSWIFSVTTFSKHSRKSINFDYDQQHNSQNTELLLSQHIYHWKTEQYWGSADRGEVDLDSDVNRPASGNLRQYTTVPSKCEQLPWTWTWRIMYFNCWYNFEKRPGIV